MADEGYGKPSNSIVVAGEPVIQTMKVETATNMYPGRFVIKGTNSDDAIVATAGSAALGILGYEHTIKKHRPATVDTIYLQNAQVAILSGPGVVVVGSLADSQTIVKGDRLIVAAAGEVAKASAAAAAAGATAVTAHTAAPTIVGPIPTEGIVVAVAEEAKTTSGSSADIMMRLLI
jgi:hypothetical protein